MQTPSAIPRGNVRRGSRTSPPILLMSHHPPNEKKPATIPPASALNKGAEPGRRGASGQKVPQSPNRPRTPHKTIKKRETIFSTASALNRLAPILTPRILAAASPTRRRSQPPRFLRQTDRP